MPTSAVSLADRARELMPGGVSSPVRAYKSVGEEPLIITSAQGAMVVDSEGKEYIDFILAYGPHILGHGKAQIIDAVRRQVERGIAFGNTSDLEIELAARICAALPSIEMLRFVNSGTEATMSAIRLARGFTNRNTIIKFEGGYHGHADALLVSAGSGIATLGIPSSAGVTPGAIEDTLVAPYNDPRSVELLLSQHEVAAVIVEPVAGNMGCVPPEAGYLQTLREQCTRHGALLIFDEVMTGFRVAYGGAQTMYQVSPDLTCLGKVIGGGFPVAAYGGRREIMELLAPLGPVYQAGTLSGNAVGMAAGIAVLDVLATGEAYRVLEQLGQLLADGLRSAAKTAGVTCAVNRVGSMLTPFVGVEKVGNYDDAKKADVAGFARIHQAWRQAGILWPPSQFETAFLSTVHTTEQIEIAVEGFVRGLSATVS